MVSFKAVFNLYIKDIDEDHLDQNAGHILNLLQSETTIADADIKTLQKFNGKVSTFLESKSSLLKWFGACLVSVSIDKSWAILKSHGATWAGLLIHILEINEKRPTKEVAISALSVIFSKTFGKQELTRDITTPKLPQYLKLLFKLGQINEENSAHASVLSSSNTNKSFTDNNDFIDLRYEEESSDEEGANSKSKITQDGAKKLENVTLSQKLELLNTIVPALNTALIQQPTTFRPFLQRYHALICKVLSLNYVSPSAVSPELLGKVCKGYALLHYSAPKDAEAVMWRFHINNIINLLHQEMSALVSKHVEEDFQIPSESDEHTNWATNNGGSSIQFEKLVLDLAKTKTGHFVQITNKINTIFTLLYTMLKTHTKTSVKFPLGSIITLVDRLLSISVYNKPLPGIEKHQQQLFWAYLDELHVKSFGLLIGVQPLVKSMMLCHLETLMHHTKLYLSFDSSSVALKLRVLHFAQGLLRLMAVVPKSSAIDIPDMVTEAFRLVLPTKDASSKELADALPNSHLFIQYPSQKQIAIVTSFFEAVILTVPELNVSIRSQIDKWLILSSTSATPDSFHEFFPFKTNPSAKTALAASALYPGKATKYSVLPMASKALPRSDLVYSIIHPRLPPSVSAVFMNDKPFASMRLGASKNENQDENDEDSNDENDEQVSNIIAKKRKLDTDSSFIRNQTELKPNEQATESKTVQSTNKVVEEPKSDVLSDLNTETSQSKYQEPIKDSNSNSPYSEKKSLSLELGENTEAAPKSNNEPIIQISDDEDPEKMDVDEDLEVKVVETVKTSDTIITQNLDDEEEDDDQFQMPTLDIDSSDEE